MKISIFSDIVKYSKGNVKFPVSYIQLKNNIRTIKVGILPLAAIGWSHWSKYIFWRTELSPRYFWFRILWFGVGFLECKGGVRCQ